MSLAGIRVELPRQYGFCARGAKAEDAAAPLVELPGLPDQHLPLGTALRASADGVDQERLAAVQRPSSDRVEREECQEGSDQETDDQGCCRRPDPPARPVTLDQ